MLKRIREECRYSILSFMWLDETRYDRISVGCKMK